MTSSGAHVPSESGGTQGARESDAQDWGVLCCDSTLDLCRGVQFLKELQAANTRLYYCEGSSHGLIKMKCSGTFLRKLKR